MGHMDGTPVAPTGASPEKTPGDALAGTPRQALGNFAALFEDADFTVELDCLGVGRMQFLRRRQMLLELRGLYMGLWFLALVRSFPDRAEELFELYMQHHAQNSPRKEDEQLRQRARQYKDMLSGTGDRDFTAVSRHLLSFMHRDEATLKTLSLRMALLLRSTYTFIFERLI